MRVGQELNKTIINLCNLINEMIEKKSYIEIDELSNITKALAELVTAKANVITD